MSQTKSIAFTKKRLESLQPPTAGSGRDYYRDERTPGLGLYVTENGTRSFFLYKKIAGRPARVLIGRFPAVTVDAARKRATELAGSIAKGADPQSDRRRARGEPTIGDLFSGWLQHAKARKRTWKEDERQFNKFLATWSTRKLPSIKPRDVAEWHNRIGKNHGPYAANRALALLRAAFNKAESIVGYSGSNPAKGVSMFPEQSRERFLQGDEMPRFFTALEAEPNGTLRDFFVIALMTGARRGNVQSMKWADVDLDARVWHITGADAKAGKPISVPLVDQAVEILNRRSAENGDGQFVFPAESKTGHLVEPKFAWRRLLERAGISDLRFHDLRHTLASFLAIGGESLSIIGKALGHGSIATTGRYAHLSHDPVRLAMDKATNTMLALSIKKPADE